MTTEKNNDEETFRLRIGEGWPKDYSITIPRSQVFANEAWTNIYLLDRLEDAALIALLVGFICVAMIACAKLGLLWATLVLIAFLLAIVCATVVFLVIYALFKRVHSLRVRFRRKHIEIPVWPLPIFGRS